MTGNTGIKYLNDHVLHQNIKDGKLSLDKHCLLRKQYACDEVRTVDRTKRQIDFIISTGSVDRMGDTIDPSGWNFKPFKKNPVILFAHDSRQPPIGKAVRIGVDGKKVVARAEFTTRDLNPFGDMIYNMYLEGFMRAVSVGFISLEFERSDDDDRPFGLDFKRQELLEFSAVPVPANPEALIEARSKGIDTLPLKLWAEMVLDDWENNKDHPIGRRTIESIRKKADPSLPVSLVVPQDVQDALRENNLELVRNYSSTSTDSFEIASETLNDVLREHDFDLIPSTLIINEESSEDRTNISTSDNAEITMADKTDSAGVEGKDAEDAGSAVETLDTDEENASVTTTSEEEAVVEAIVTKNTDDEEEEEAEAEEDQDEDEEGDKALDHEASLKSLLDVTDKLFEIVDDVKASLDSTRSGRRLLRDAAEAFVELATVLQPLDDESSKAVLSTARSIIDSNSTTEEEDPKKNSKTDGENASTKEFMVEDADPAMIAGIVKDILPEIVKTITAEEVGKVQGRIDDSQVS